MLDPQGKAIQHSLHALGYTEVEDARVGKMIELQVEEGPELETRITEMCDKLLANPVIENYILAGQIVGTFDEKVARQLDDYRNKIKADVAEMRDALAKK